MARLLRGFEYKFGGVAFEVRQFEGFCGGLNINRSIRKIAFNAMNLGGIFQSLLPFFENNNNLAELWIQRCEFGAGSARQLLFLLSGCNKSLKSVKLEDNQIGDELVDVIEAIGMDPQLEYLALPSMRLGNYECRALSTVVRSMTRLSTLDLSCNNIIDDDGVDALTADLLTKRLPESCRSTGKSQFEFGDAPSLPQQYWQ